MTTALLLTVLAGSGLTQAWKAPAGDWSGSTPIVAISGDTVVFAGYQDLRQLRASDGALVKKISKGNCFGAAIDLRVEGGLALVLCESPRGEGLQPQALHSTLAAIDLKTGKTRWSRDGSIPAPIAVEGALVVFADGERVIALDLAMGKPVWSGKALTGRYGVASGGGIVAVASDGAVIAVSLSDGTLKWGGPLAGWPQAAPIINAQTVFVIHDPASGDEKRRKKNGNRLTALSVADGKARWTRDFKGESLFIQPVVWGELILVMGMGEDVADGHLWALKQSSGEVAWSVPWASDANGHDFRPALLGEVMLTWAAVPKPIGEYQLSAFDPGTGAVKWTFSPRTNEKFMFSRPVGVAGRIVYADGETVRGLTGSTLQRGRVGQ